MPPSSPDRGLRLALISLFALSGGTALIYEVVWTRLLGLMVGHTTYGLTTVLAAYMAGLGLGGWLGGRIGDRSGHPLRLYAGLEAGIAVAGASLGHLLLALEPVFGWVYRAAPQSTGLLTGLRFLLCGAVMLVPTVLMGMTLPVLTRQLARSEGRIGGDVGLLYGANTLGAAGGSLLCGFLLLPALGMTRTALLAAAGNLVVAAVAFLAARWYPAPGELAPLPVAPAAPDGKVRAAAPPAPPWAAQAAVGALLLSSACAMAQQVAWVRAVGLAIGSTTYAFTLIVAVFILGLALGAAWFGRVADRVQDRVALLGAILLGTGAAALLVLPLVGRLPLWVVGIVARSGGGHRQVLVGEAVRVLLLLLVPTFFMGGVFPVVARIVTPGLERIGRAVGGAYAASTGGSIVGAVAAGFLLVPLIGARGTSLAAGAASLAGGVLLLVARQPARPLSAARRGTELLLGGFLAGVGAGLLPGWSPAVMNSGAYVNAGRILTESARSGVPVEQVVEATPLLWWKEGIDDTVAVGRNHDGSLFLTVNGKPDASSEGDLVTMVLSAHLPLALHPAPTSALVIGLGSGLTAGSAALHPLERMDVAEISTGVVEAARRFFPEVNRGVLEDPRVRLLVGDARTTVGQGVGTYDVISSQPSNLYMAGVPSLFTVEFFEICRRRLAPGGVMAQWIHAYNLSPDDFRTAVRTFTSVFPAVSLWDAHLGSDFLLIGTDVGTGAPPLAVERLRALLAQPGLAEDMARIGIHGPADFLGWFVAEGEDLREFAGEGPRNTVDHNILEFSVPRSMRLGPGLQLLTEMDALRHRHGFAWVTGKFDEDLPEAANQHRWDTKRFIGTLVNGSLGDVQTAFGLYREITPREGPLAWNRARSSLLDVVWRMMQAGALEDAVRLAQALSADDPGDPRPLQMLAEAAWRAGNREAVRKALEGLLSSRADEEILAWARQNLNAVDKAGEEDTEPQPWVVPEPGEPITPSPTP